MSLQAELVMEDDDTVCSKCNAEFHGIVHKRFHCSGHLVMYGCHLNTYLVATAYSSHEHSHLFSPVCSDEFQTGISMLRM